GARPRAVLPKGGPHVAPGRSRADAVRGLRELSLLPSPHRRLVPAAVVVGAGSAARPGRRHRPATLGRGDWGPGAAVGRFASPSCGLVRASDILDQGRRPSGPAHLARAAVTETTPRPRGLPGVLF